MPNQKDISYKIECTDTGIPSITVFERFLNGDCLQVRVSKGPSITGSCYSLFFEIVQVKQPGDITDVQYNAEYAGLARPVSGTHFDSKSKQWNQMSYRECLVFGRNERQNITDLMRNAPDPYGLKPDFLEYF